MEMRSNRPHSSPESTACPDCLWGRCWWFINRCNNRRALDLRHSGLAAEFIAAKTVSTREILILMPDIRLGRRKKICWIRKDARGGKDESRVRSRLWGWKKGKEFAWQESSVIYAPRKKEIAHRAPVLFLWQPEGYYRTLPFIMKGLWLTGSETGWGDFFPSTAGKQKEKE